jgi:hypothetical protein
VSTCLAGGGASSGAAERAGLARACRPTILLLALLVAAGVSAAPLSGTSDLRAAAANDAGEVAASPRPSPGQSAPTAGPSLPLPSAAAAAGVDLPFPACRPLGATARRAAAGDRPGHRLRVERPPRPAA